MVKKIKSFILFLPSVMAISSPFNSRKRDYNSHLRGEKYNFKTILCKSSRPYFRSPYRVSSRLCYLKQAYAIE
jgi:hypothetical protein